MQENIRIEPDHALYPQLLRDWTRNGKPSELDSLNVRWIVVQDNDKMVFVQKNGGSGIDSRYSSTSMPMR